MMPRYSGLDIDNALVILDWSGWVRRAWHASGLDVEKTAGIVAGWLAALLSDPMPNRLVAACDPPRRRHTGFRASTWRHYATKNLEEKRQYKANRPPAAPELMAAEDALDKLLRLHSIPTLGPADATVEQNWEADDAAATAVRLASQCGRPCILVSIDKDWTQLVSTSDPSRPMVICWDPQRDAVIDDAFVLAKWNVEPRHMCDMLALMGDNGDNVPGVRGIGPKKAAELIWEFGGLDAAIVAANDDMLRETNRVLRILHEQQEHARFSRSLVRLWDEAPIDWDVEAQHVGGFDARGLERLYRSFGHTRLATSVPSFPKRAALAEEA
jgi:5'-3' exonuclease